MRYLWILAVVAQLLPCPSHADAPACTTIAENAGKYRTRELLAAMRSDCGQVVGDDSAAAAYITRDVMPILWSRLMLEPLAAGFYISEINDPTAPTNFRLVLLSIAGQTRIPAVLSAVETLAANDPDVTVRRESITALGASGLVVVFDTLIQIWASESDNEARARVLLSLGDIGNQDIWNHAREEFARQWARTPYNPLTPGPSPAVLTAGQESQLQALFAGALNDQSYQVRIAAADAIAHRHFKRMARQLVRDLANETPANRTPSPNTPGILIENKMVKVRLINAVRLLGASGQENALISFLANEHDPDVLAVGLDALGAIGSGASANLIVAALASHDDFVAMHAAMAAASLGQTGLRADIQGRITTAQDSFAIGKMTEAANVLAK